MPDPKGIVMSNQANNTSGKHIHNYSSFDESLSYRLANTLRFGEYTPSFEMEGVEKDQISVNSLDRIDSLSLKAPFKGTIRKIKESFKVPNMAILPKQWDRVYAQPSNGDDVPDDANCVIEDWLPSCKSLWSNAYDKVRTQLASWSNASGTTYAQVCTLLTAALRTMVLGEYMFSAGSLLHVSGYRYGTQFFEFPKQTPQGAGFVTYDMGTYDYWFDQACYALFSHIRDVTVSVPVGSGYVTRHFECLDDTYPAYQWYGKFRALLECFRENPLSQVTALYADDRFANADQLAQDLSSAVDGTAPFYKQASYFHWCALESHTVGDDVTELNPAVLNLSRVLAYQLVCAHFYTNSSIDFIYSAELYRQYIYNLYTRAGFVNTGSAQTFNRFTWNGISLEYDYLSGHILSQLLFYAGGTSYHQYLNSWNNLSTLGGSIATSANVPYLICLAAWSAIFAFRKSLRYGDYFTASRPRPLAPINTDVSVNSNMVSVVDITRNIQAQRFANAVMRSRSKVEEYVKSLFGKAPAPDFHNPFFLVRQTETIFGDDVQNTGASQSSDPNSRTANFASNVGQHTFTFHNDDMHPCIYLQIISFDIRRAYTRSVDRQMLHINRFDMFNPDFQYIGDQPVYGIELGYKNASDQVPDVFSYQSRDMEYKQRFDVASGGFIENLPGWFLTDLDRSHVQLSNLDPDFIRSYNTELDQFFLSLTGFSLASYFHFICITSNNVNAKRAMAVDPQILA